MASQERGYHRIGGIAWAQRTVRGGTRGHVSQGYDSDRLLLAFVVHIKEGPIFNDGSAQGCSVLIIVERSLRVRAPIRILCRIEIVAGI